MALTKSTSPSSSMLYSFLLFLTTLSAQQAFAAKLASSEWLTILGGLIGSILFLFSLTFIGNLQEYMGMRTGWGAVFVSLFIAATAAAFVHRVSCTSCILLSVGVLYEMTRVSSIVHPTIEGKKEGKKKL